MDSLVIRFLPRKSKNGLLYLYLRITINGVPKDSALHRTVEKEKWNHAGQCMKGTTEEVKIFNAFLQGIKMMVHDHYNLMLQERKPITTARLVDRLTGIGTKETMLLEVFKKHNERMKSLLPSGDYAEGTYNKYRFAYDKVKKFIKHRYKASDMALYKLNYDFMANLEQFLKVHEKIAHNTTMKYLSNLKKITNLCVASGWLSSNPFATFKLTLKDVPRSQLTDAELLNMSTKQLTTRLARVRDVFLFTCYTGMAYIDVFDLCWRDIQIGFDGKLWVIYNRHKNENRAPVPLLPNAREILNRYPVGGSDEKVFPVRSNQKFNQYLKEIASECGIDKRLHCHLGRHTFATTVCLSNGVPMETIGKMLGQKSLRSTQLYARVVDQKISEEMQTLERKLLQKIQGASAQNPSSTQ